VRGLLGAPRGSSGLLEAYRGSSELVGRRGAGRGCSGLLGTARNCSDGSGCTGLSPSPLSAQQWADRYRRLEDFSERRENQLRRQPIRSIAPITPPDRAARRTAESAEPMAQRPLSRDFPLRAAPTRCPACNAGHLRWRQRGDSEATRQRISGSASQRVSESASQQNCR
jgi:hypothetical protein